MGDFLSLEKRLGVAAYLLGLLADLRKDLNPEAAAEWEPGERRAIKFGGQLAGWASVPKPAKRAKVTHEARLLAWVREHQPHQIETIERVRPEHIKALGDEMKRHGGWLNKETGEYEPVPGIEVTPGEPSPRVELGDQAGAVIGQAWRAGEIDLSTVLALPGVEENAQATA